MRNYMNTGDLSKPINSFTVEQCEQVIFLPDIKSLSSTKQRERLFGIHTPDGLKILMAIDE